MNIATEKTSLNILMLAPEFPPGGGIGTRSYASARNLSADGHRLTILVRMSNSDLEEQENSEFNVVNISCLNGLNINNPFSFIFMVIAYSVYGLFYARRHRIDLCYATIAHIGIAALVIRKIWRIPYVLAVHGMEVAGPTSIGRKWMKPVLANASACIVLADRQRRSLKVLGVEDRKIVTIPEGIDSEKFYPKKKCLSIIERHHLSGKKVILTVGRLVTRKGHDKVIEAMPAVAARIPDAVYLIVGTGPEERKLKNLAISKKVQDRVIFTGYVPEALLVDYYSVSDVFIMPSREIGMDIEGFGLVFLEANACGKPVIGGDSGGVSDAVADGVSGILVDPESAVAVEKAITKLLTDSNFAQKLGRQGRERVEKEFSGEVIQQKIRTMLKDIGVVIPAGRENTGR